MEHWCLYFGRVEGRAWQNSGSCVFVSVQFKDINIRIKWWSWNAWSGVLSCRTVPTEKDRSLAVRTGSSNLCSSTHPAVSPSSSYRLCSCCAFEPSRAVPCRGASSFTEDVHNGTSAHRVMLCFSALYRTGPALLQVALLQLQTLHGW